MPPPLLDRSLLDDDGYPVWVRELAAEEHGIGLYVVRGLHPANAMERVGGRRAQFRTVELPADRPEDEWASRVTEAVGVGAGEASALVAFRVGDWTVVYDAGGLTTMDQESVADLSEGGREAAVCTVNIELDTHLEYAVDGEHLFWVGEPISVYRLDELPEGLRPAAAAAGIDWTPHGGPDEESRWEPAENFRVVCALAGLRLTFDDVRALPLLGAAFG